MLDFKKNYQPKMINERFKEKYISEVWQYLLKNKAAVLSIQRTGLSYLYLEEFNKHLKELHPYMMTQQELINLYGLAGAQCNIIFNFYADKYA